MSELADIREAIASALEGVAAITKVERYERADTGTNNLPAASLFLVSVGRPNHDTGFELPRFGSQDYQAEWRINIRLGAAAPLYEVTAQQLFETLFAGVRDAFATNSQLLTSTANTTYASAITAGTLFLPAGAGDPFVAQYTLTTITLT